MNFGKLIEQVGFKGEADEFEEAFGIEKKEHSELDDLTVAHIVADHLRKDPEYYEKEEDETEEDSEEEFNKENDSDKEDAEEMSAEFNKILKSKMAGKGE